MVAPKQVLLCHTHGAFRTWPTIVMMLSAALQKYGYQYPQPGQLSTAVSQRPVPIKLYKMQVKSFPTTFSRPAGSQQEAVR
ncbi:hypothetical protein BaRGS_00003565 [Batillaria attramentaria]|uniref:Uncharacterized protein n=1 Tax=Batillaria attramentaria TaxID=370345 RepID=A0ABD0M140_9CAEN